MARFEKFGDYMFSLLFAPLRKGKRATNQFYIFFKVVGKLFDDCKQDLFKVRAESMIVSASESILTEHGRERNMPRLKNEDVDTYRTRLSMKAITAEKSGTKEGISLAVKSLGYLDSEIIPYRNIDPERWAEFLVHIRLSLDYEKIVDYGILKKAVRDVKEASALDNYEFVMSHKFTEAATELVELQITNRMQISWWPSNRTLDGSFLLDGSHYLDSELLNYPIIITCNSDPVEIIEIP